MVSCWGFYIIVRKASEGSVRCGRSCTAALFLFAKKQEVEVYSLLTSIMFNKDLSMSSSIGGYKDEKCWDHKLLIWRKSKEVDAHKIVIKNCEIVFKILMFMFYLSICKIPSVTLKHILKKQLIKNRWFLLAQYSLYQCSNYNSFLVLYSLVIAQNLDFLAQ